MYLLFTAKPNTIYICYVNPSMTLDDYLVSKQKQGAISAETATSIMRLADAAHRLTAIIRQHGTIGDGKTDLAPNNLPPNNLAESVGASGKNSTGDTQKQLDVLANDIIAECLADCGAAFLLSEEEATPRPLTTANKRDSDQVLVAVDPLDGSSNIDVNITIGTIFSVMPYQHGKPPHPCAGRKQLAAGFFAYGPQTVLVLGVADTTPPQGFVMNEATSANTPASQAFTALPTPFTIPATTNEFAINSAYANYWHPPMSAWIAEVTQGKHGVRHKDYRMRWVGSLVADAWRIFCRGGIFLYPADKREHHAQGRLRLVYEANPIAFLAEKAGGAASDGATAILDVEVKEIHQRTPFFFGASGEVERLIALHKSPPKASKIPVK